MTITQYKLDTARGNINKHRMYNVWPVTHYIPRSISHSKDLSVQYTAGIWLKRVYKNALTISPHISRSGQTTPSAQDKV